MCIPSGDSKAEHSLGGCMSVWKYGWEMGQDRKERRDRNNGQQTENDLTLRQSEQLFLNGPWSEVTSTPHCANRCLQITLPVVSKITSLTYICVGLNVIKYDTVQER